MAKTGPTETTDTPAVVEPRVSVSSWLSQRGYSEHVSETFKMLYSATERKTLTEWGKEYLKQMGVSENAQ
jgi:hypothetical protein